MFHNIKENDTLDLNPRPFWKTESGSVNLDTDINEKLKLSFPLLCNIQQIRQDTFDKKLKLV